jgi:TorA maturation chaperone TorD
MDYKAGQVNGAYERQILGTFCKAVGEDLELLAALHDRELDALAIRQLKELEFPSGLGLALQNEASAAALRQMETAMAAFEDEEKPGLLDDLAVDFADIYITYRVRAAPTESVWLDKDHLMRQQPMFQVREVYRRRGLKIVDEHMRPDDHIVTELRFLAHLFGKCGDGEALREAAGFLDQHILRWIGLFSEAVTARCRTNFYASLAVLTAAYCDELRDVLARWLDEPRPALEQGAPKGDEDVTGEAPLPIKNPLTSPSW